MDQTTSTLTTLLLGPGGALVLMVLGGRWLMARLEKADEVRASRDNDFKTLVTDNTRAMLAMEAALCKVSDRVQSLTNGLQREVTDPGLRAVGTEKRE